MWRGAFKWRLPHPSCLSPKPSHKGTLCLDPVPLPSHAQCVCACAHTHAKSDFYLSSRRHFLQEASPDSSLPLSGMDAPFKQPLSTSHHCIHHTVWPLLEYLTSSLFFNLASKNHLYAPISSMALAQRRYPGICFVD